MTEQHKDYTSRHFHPGDDPYIRDHPKPNGGAAASAPLSWTDMSRWDDGDPEPIEWSITDIVPREQTGLFTGVGGTGKTTTELLKDVAHVVGLPWFNWMPTQGPVLFIGCEDPDKVWRIRLTVIARHYRTTFANLIAGGFHLLNLFGQDATLFHHNNRSGRVEATLLYKQIYQMAGDLKPINISLDPLARVFAGNEMDRVQAYGVSALAQALALASGGSVTLLSHPSLRGISTGSGYSGSTAWHDAFRYRQYLRAAQDDEDENQPLDPANDTGLRELSFMKNQYGPPSAKLTLRWRNGLFLPETAGNTLEKAAGEAGADQGFLDLLDRYSGQGRNVSATANSPNYAPTTFAKEASGFNKKQLDAAMRRLFTAHKIHMEPYRQDGHTRQRIARI
jgi:RecA-family ATPase